MGARFEAVQYSQVHSSWFQSYLCLSVWEIYKVGSLWHTYIRLKPLVSSISTLQQAEKWASISKVVRHDKPPLIIYQRIRHDLPVNPR